MTRRTHLRACLFLLSLTIAPAAFGIWGTFTNDRPVEGGGWPPQVLKAINAHRRVYGVGSDFGLRFYFAGDTDAVNRFLAQVAAEKDVPLEVVLVPEPGKAEEERAPIDTDFKSDFSWSLHLEPYRDRLFIERKAGESDEQYAQRLAAERAKAPAFSAKVTVHCTGPIDPAGLKIPLRFKATVGGRLAKLAAYHNGRRERLEKEHRGFEDGPPSDVRAAEAPHDFFGSPDTKPAQGGGQ